MQKAVPVLALFLLGWVVRLLFVSASPDGLGPFSPFYKGDAPLWLAYAASLQQGQPFALELGLPLRPPGNAWLVDVLWDGTVEGLPGLRGAYTLLGACAVPLTFVVACRLGRLVACVAAALVAVSFGSIQLAASPNVEAPYQLLALGTLWAAQVARGRRSLGWWALLGLVLGAGCLFRAEHALLGAGLLAWAWAGTTRGTPRRMVWARLGCALGVASVVLVPWHLDAWARVAAFNRMESPLRSARTLPWTEEAVAAIDALPGFARADAQRLIEETARHRRTFAVSLAEVAVLDEAFGWRPEPLPEAFFVALYGPLNFYLAQTVGPGFGRDALEVLPPLDGGRDRYPPGWLGSLPPPGGLSLSYPPHLRPLLHGYRDGLAVLLRDPQGALATTMQKLWRGLRGATAGIGGLDLPGSGPLVRHRVDQAVSTSVVANLWSVALLAAAIVGLWRGRGRMEELAPFLWWGAAGLAVVALFFGYARLGALLTPIVGVLLGLAVEPLALRAPRGALWGSLVLLLAVLAIETGRWWRGVRIFVDGAEVKTVEPWPPLEFEDRQLTVRSPDQEG
ncbi:MAG: hypothetical protein RL562_2986 [Planctomycetota bacterium]